MNQVVGAAAVFLIYTFETRNIKHEVCSSDRAAQHLEREKVTFKTSNGSRYGRSNL